MKGVLLEPIDNVHGLRDRRRSVAVIASLLTLLDLNLDLGRLYRLVVVKVRVAFVDISRRQPVAVARRVELHLQRADHVLDLLSRISSRRARFTLAEVLRLRAHELLLTTGFDERVLDQEG